MFFNYYFNFSKKINNIFKLYLNVFKHLTGIKLQNYGVFFTKEELDEEAILENCNFD